MGGKSWAVGSEHRWPNGTFELFGQRLQSPRQRWSLYAYQRYVCYVKMEVVCLCVGATVLNDQEFVVSPLVQTGKLWNLCRTVGFAFYVFDSAMHMS